MNYDTINKTIELFYGFLPYGSNFSDATYGLLKDNQEERYEIERFLLEEEILEDWGDSGKLIISKKGKIIWKDFSTIEKFIEHTRTIDSRKEKLKQIEEQKLINDSKISKWQAKTFWWVFVFGLIGGICGIISLTMQIKENINKQKPKTENVKSKSN